MWSWLPVSQQQVLAGDQTHRAVQGEDDDDDYDVVVVVDDYDDDDSSSSSR